MDNKEKMTDPKITNQEKYYKDRATVMSTVKYLLYAAIIAALLFFASRIIVIFIPFLVGFVLAKASRTIADAILRIPERRHKKRISESHKYIPAPETKKPNRIVRFFFPAVGEKRYSQRTRVTIIVYVFLLILVFLGAAWVIGALAVQISNALSYVQSLTAEMAENNTSIAQMASDAIENALSYLSRFVGSATISSIRENIYSVVDNFGTTLFNIFESVAGSLLSMLGSLPMVIFYIIAVIMSGYYFITDGRSMMRFFANNIKNRRFRMRTLRLLDRLSFTLFRVLGGYMVLLIITFIESWIVFKIADIKYAAIFATITAVLDFMPVLGISATMIPMMVYVTAQGDFRALVILIIGMTLMTIIRQTIEPRILGKSLNLHPLATILGMIIGVYVWGALGFLIGPVVLIVVMQTMKVFSLDKKLRRFIEGLLNRMAESDDEEDKKNVGKEPKEPSEKTDDTERLSLGKALKDSASKLRKRRGGNDTEAQKGSEEK